MLILSITSSSLKKSDVTQLLRNFRLGVLR